MKNDIINSIPVLTFSLFSNISNLKCYAFTKDNGNLSLSYGDEESVQHRKAITNAFQLEKFYEVHQIHGDSTCEWNALQDSDGIYTNKPNIPLFIRTADCQAAVFFDPANSVLSVVHAGWRGLDKKIYTKTIRRLEERYGTKASDLLVGIGPSISAESFEFKDNPPGFMLDHAIGASRYDLKSAAKKELLDAGVLEKNLEIAPECTFKDLRFYSYRREKTASRQGVLAWICS